MKKMLADNFYYTLNQEFMFVCFRLSVFPVDATDHPQKTV